MLSVFAVLSLYVQTWTLASAQETQHAVVCYAITSRLRMHELHCSHIRIVHLAGAKLLQLYREWEAGISVTAGPSSDRLEAVAVQFASQGNWGSAMSMGAELASQQQHMQAAQIACTVMKGIQGHSLDASLLHQALPWLSAASKHREAIQVLADFNVALCIVVHSTAHTQRNCIRA